MMGRATDSRPVGGEKRRRHSFESYSDTILMSLLQEGEMGALGILYRRHGGMVAAAIVATVPRLQKEEVEDLTQDVFVTVAAAAKKYREKGKLKSWLYSVAVRTAKKRRRTIQNRKRLLDANAGHTFAVAGELPLPERDVMARLDLFKAFVGLSDIQRQALVLFEHQGFSGEEIAETMNIKLNTVWSHLRRARAAVSTILDDTSARSFKEVGK